MSEVGRSLSSVHSMPMQQMPMSQSSPSLSQPLGAVGRNALNQSDRAKQANGSAFDREYLQEMVQDNQKSSQTFEKEVSSARDLEVKSFASQLLLSRFKGAIARPLRGGAG